MEMLNFFAEIWDFFKVMKKTREEEIKKGSKAQTFP